MTHLFAILIQLITIATSILGLGLLIFLHECGHFFVCKWLKIKVNTFSVGFGPVIGRTQLLGSNFVLSAIPLGGFVEPADSSQQEEARHQGLIVFENASYAKKVAVISAGVLVNALISLTLLTFVFHQGAPATPQLSPLVDTPNIAALAPDGLAHELGLQTGDRITQVTYDNNSLTYKDHTTPIIPALIKARSADNASITVQRGQQELTLPLPAKSAGQSMRRIFGISLQHEKLAPKSIASSIKAAYGQMLYWSQGFLQLFSKPQASSLGGPIRMIADGSKVATQGLLVFLCYLAVISANLALLNLVPLPVFDGGQLVITSIQHVMGRPLSDTAKMTLFGGTWIVLLALFAVLTVKDIWSLFC